MEGIQVIESVSRRKVHSPELEDREDDNAIESFRSGDHSSFDALVFKYRGHIYRLCYRFMGNHHDADDMAQEVFLRAYRGLPKFKGRSKFSTWLYRIAVNTCLNRVSARKVPVEQLPSMEWS